VVSPAVRSWQRTTKGVGEHLLALLLAEVGDPAIAWPMTWGRPERPSDAAAPGHPSRTPAATMPPAAALRRR
jgi:hypothetical protein